MIFWAKLSMTEILTENSSLAQSLAEIIKIMSDILCESKYNWKPSRKLIARKLTGRNPVAKTLIANISPMHGNGLHRLHGLQRNWLIARELVTRKLIDRNLEHCHKQVTWLFLRITIKLIAMTDCKVAYISSPTVTSWSHCPCILKDHNKTHCNDWLQGSVH